MKDRYNVDEAIKKATREAIREYGKEQKEEQRVRVLHNTKLLLKHYNSLKKHSERAVFNVNDVEDVEEYPGDDRAYVLSIRRSKLRTIIMVSHIEMALEELKEKKIREDNYDQYKALKLYYIDKMGYEEIQEKLSCGKNSPPRWINIAMKDLSILLFGLDGLILDEMV
ncbi:MAG: hypothetical protein RR891_06125 [Clostridium sp.]